ncbi:MAG TPA: 16S rRNA (uracil(1498)-N(3))-methyltransferase [Pyrinomonadaceae bacterium]|nr:16S rRNA (uracil(1498)-N(3))-methyltransferase [Pyrinomonadaceae bacterium]
MTRRRFHAPPSAFNFETLTVTLAADEARHLREVLRLKTGDAVYVFDGAGREFRCIVENARRDSAELRIDSEPGPAKPESQLQLKLGVALLKGEKFDLVVQKATELGVQQIVPVITRYADIQLRDESDANKRVARWQRIALEAAKQSGRAVVPEVTTPVSFESFLAGTKDAELCLMFSERDGGGLWLIAGHGPRSVTALVGSEGGWSDEEIELARVNEFHVITLGGRILRAETAAIAATALLQHLFGDLR